MINYREISTEMTFLYMLKCASVEIITQKVWNGELLGKDTQLCKL